MSSSIGEQVVEEEVQIEDDFSDVLQKCVAAFDYQNKRLGISYYVSDSKELFLASDLDEEAPFECWKAAINQINPSLILLSSRANDALYEHADFEEFLKSSEVRPRSEFSSNKALDKIIVSTRDHDLEPDEVIHLGPGLGDEEARLRQARIRLEGRLDTKSELGLGCIGALLSYIDRKRDVSNVRGLEYLAFMVESVTMFRLDSTMVLNADTLVALRVFENMQESKQKRKDNPSLFGIVNRCRTTSGRALLKHWFLAPTTDILVIETRHDAIECLISPYNAQISDKISQIIGKCADMHNALEQLQAGQHGSSRGGVWQVLLNFAFHAVKVLEKVEEMRGNTEIDVLRRICASFDVPSLQRIGALINDVIDFDGSEAEERIMVKRLVDEELDRHKDVYDSLEEVLNKVCSEIAAMIPNQYEDVVQCVYLPQLGFLTVMPAQETDAPTEPDQILPVWQSEEWTIHFSTEKSVYFKSEHMAELDEYFGDVHSLVVDREIELLYQLQLRILEHSQLLLNCSEIIAELDCLLAYALAAKKYKWVRPQMTDRNVLSVQGGRHPLYELVVDVFVPNDVHVIGRDVGEEPVNNRLSEHENENGDDIPNLILMTGANFSGKSVYLKQMALIVYMAHIGSFVPAKSALVGITDRILTRLMTRRSVTQAESSFMCDLQQVSVALQLMTARSLLVIDEFGKGTEACDGAALFGALVEHLTDANNIRPRSLVSTHFHEVLRPEYMRMNSAMSLKHMEIIINKNAEQIKDQIAHLYRVADGPTLSSFGINCAALGGVPDHILARAQQLLEIQARGDCLTEALSVLTDKEREELKEAEGLVRRFAAWDVHAEPVENVRARLAEIIAG